MRTFLINLSLLIGVFVVFTGCTPLKPAADPVVVDKAKPSVAIDRRLLKPCSRLSLIQGQRLAETETVMKGVKPMIDLYGDCSSRQQKLLDVLTDALNIKDPEDPLAQNGQKAEKVPQNESSK